MQGAIKQTMETEAGEDCDKIEFLETERCETEENLLIGANRN